MGVIVRRQGLIQFLIPLVVLFSLAVSSCSGGGNRDGDDGDGLGNGGGAGGGGSGLTISSGSESLGPHGGIIDFGDLEISVRPGALTGPISISAAATAIPKMPPTGLSPVGEAVSIDISPSDQTRINGPLSITLHYSSEGVRNENDLLVLHLDSGTDSYQAVRINRLDTAGDVIEFESRSFSSFVLVAIDGAIPASFNTGFDPALNGWSIPNFGSYFSPEGNCLGMSGYGLWYFTDGAGSLSTQYSGDVARIAAVRSHLAQSQSWAISDWRALQVLPEGYIGRTMKAYMTFLGDPLILTMGTDGNPAHASIVYAFDTNNFYFYDVNFPGEAQQVAFDGATFGSYGAYNDFGFVGMPSLGRTEDFAELAAEATAGFLVSDEIFLASPAADAIVTSEQTQLTGALSGSLSPSTQVLAFIRGVQQIIPVDGGTFNETIPVSTGENTLVLIAGTSIEEQSNWYKNSGALIRNFEGQQAPSAKCDPDRPCQIEIVRFLTASGFGERVSGPVPVDYPNSRSISGSCEEPVIETDNSEIYPSVLLDFRSGVPAPMCRVNGVWLGGRSYSYSAPTPTGSPHGYVGCTYETFYSNYRSSIQPDGDSLRFSYTSDLVDNWHCTNDDGLTISTYSYSQGNSEVLVMNILDFSGSASGSGFSLTTYDGEDPRFYEGRRCSHEERGQGSYQGSWTAQDVPENRPYLNFEVGSFTYPPGSPIPDECL